MDFEPLSWRKNSPSRRRRDSEFVRKIGGKSVGRASRVPRSGCFCFFFYKTGVSLRLHSNLFYQKFVMMANRTRGARGGFDLNRTLGQSPRHRLADSAATPKEKTLLAFLICAGWIFSEKRKGCFSFGVLPSKYSGSRRGEMRTRFCQTIFWGKGFGKTETNLILYFVRAEEGSGEESARAFLFIRIGKRKSGSTFWVPPLV